MILELRVFRGRGRHRSSNYFYFQDEGDPVPEEATALALAVKTITEASFRQFQSLNTAIVKLGFRSWPESLSSPASDWWFHDYTVPVIGVVPTFDTVNPELCARIDTRSDLGSRRNFLAYIPEGFSTNDGLALTISGRAGFGSINGLLFANWVHVSWSRKLWAPVDVVDVLDAITSHQHRRPDYRMFSTETDPF